MPADKFDMRFDGTKCKFTGARRAFTITRTCKEVRRESLSQFLATALLCMSAPPSHEALAVSKFVQQIGDANAMSPKQLNINIGELFFLSRFSLARSTTENGIEVLQPWFDTLGGCRISLPFAVRLQIQHRTVCFTLDVRNEGRLRKSTIQCSEEVAAVRLQIMILSLTCQTEDVGTIQQCSSTWFMMCLKACRVRLN